MAIEGYLGRRGKGKTYTLTRRVLRVHRRYAVVAANYWIDVPNLLKISGPEDLLPGGALDRVMGCYCLTGFYVAMGGGRKKWRQPRWRVLLVLDEAQNWFPSRQSMKLPPSIVWVWSQTRKLAWDVLWSSQHASRVDKVVKDNTDWMWHCEKWLSWLTLSGRPLFYTATAYEPEDFQKRDRKKRGPVAIVPFRWKVARAYNTVETVSVAEHLASVKDFYQERVSAG